MFSKQTLSAWIKEAVPFSLLLLFTGDTLDINLYDIEILQHFRKKHVLWRKIISLISHLSLNRKGRLGTTDDFTTSFLHFSLFSTAPCRTPGLSIPWCCLPTSSSVCLVFFPLSLCLARWFWPDLMNGDMSISLQFASLHDRQEVLVWSDCLLDLGMNFLVGNMVFVWDV